MNIYKIISEKDWQQVKDQTTYEPEELKKEGFIHLSLKNQVIGVANSVFTHVDDLIVLIIDTEKLTKPNNLIMEDLYELGEDYPHLYSPLNMDAIIGQSHIMREKDSFKFID